MGRELILYGKFFLSLSLILFLIALFFISREKLEPAYFLIFLSLPFLLINRLYVIDKKYKEITSQEFSRDTYYDISGKVISRPVYKKGLTSFLMKVDNSVSPKIQVKRDFVINLLVKGNLTHILRGSRLSLATTIKPLIFNNNFNTGFFKDYNIYKNIHFKGFCKSPLLINKVIPPSFPVYQAESFVKYLHDTILKESGKNISKAFLLEAFLFGERNSLDSELREKLIKGGVYHLFAISGVHIAIIVLILNFILLKFKVYFKYRYLGIITFLIFYLYLCDFPVSALRASIVAIVYYLAKLFDLDYSFFNIVGFTAFIILISNPWSIVDVGFYLTFIISLGIYSSFLLYQGEGNKSYIKSFLLAGIVAYIIGGAMSIFFFYRFSPLSFFLTYLLTPLVVLLIFFAVLIVIFSPLSFMLKFFIQAAFFCSKIFFLLVNSFAPTAKKIAIYKTSPIDFWIFLPLFAIISLPFIKNKDRAKKAGYLLFTFILLLIFAPIIRKKGNEEFHVLDVGQGDSQLFVFKDRSGVLIDGGGSPFGDAQTGYRILFPYLVKNKIKLDIVALSHAHKDHIGGLTEICSIFQPKELWLSCKENKEIDNLIDNCGLKTKIYYLKSGYKRRVKGWDFHVLSPNEIRKGKARNSDSQVLLIKNNRHTLLLTGDIEKNEEFNILTSYKDILKADILKVPHHGSSTSSTKDFVNAIFPKYALIGCAKYNSFGFPHKAVLNRYKKVGAKIFDTGRFGAIKLELSQFGINYTLSKF